MHNRNETRPLCMSSSFQSRLPSTPRSVSSEFERAMIRDRVMAGLDRARSSGKRLGRPRTTPFKIDRIRAAQNEGRGVRETARLLKVSATKVSEVRRPLVLIDPHP